MIHFNSVIMHNFGSYQHAEIDLQNKGFCLVTGENHRKEDNALSNGSGKSMCWSAICFAITGETIQGIKTGLKNIYNDEPDAYVSLDFIVDKDHYILKRIIAPRSDLKIEKNNQDVSGKGIRESEAKLAELLPDLTADLLTSSILIGQGMPNKFSSFKPSGRKEILEKLTKSDFMIADMKTRIENRKEVLNTQMSETSNKLLITRTKLEGGKLQLKSLKDKQANNIKPDFDRLILEAKDKLTKITVDITATNNQITDFDAKIQKINKELLEANNDKLSEKTLLLEQYSKATADDKVKKTSYETELRLAKSALAKINAHPDICPTCGQKMPNSDHIKLEKTEKEKQIQELTEKLNQVNKKLTEAEIKNKQYSTQIETKHAGKLKSLNDAIQIARNNLTTLKSNLASLNHQADLVKDEIRNETAKQASWDKEQLSLTESINKLEADNKALEIEQKDLCDSVGSLTEHLAVVKQLETLTKRDFRGYILSDIIKYIDKRAKDFSEIIFKHRDLNIYLDGNDLDISYNGKMLDNLSGGERQRVDLITQFAIRDLLVSHLNMSSNILVLDEITDFLDKTSCEAVMSLVEKELNSIESVFIVSHHAESLNIAVDSELKIVKDSSGISSVLIN